MPKVLFLLTLLLALPPMLIACSSEAGEALPWTIQPETGAEPTTATAGPTRQPTPALTREEPEAYPEPIVEAQSTPSAPPPPSPPSPAPYPEGYETLNSPGESAERLDSSNEVYVPFAGGAAIAPAPTLEPTPEPQPTLDVAAVRAELQAQGQEIGFIKAGFHVTLPEDREVLDGWMARLDAAGIPFFLKSVDNAEPLFKAQNLMRESGLPHVLVYRSTGSVPHYELPPEQAAQLHWEVHRDLFPPELDPSQVWIETLNEPDRTKAEWLAQFAAETARLAMADGFRWAAFGWASGEPEPEHWRGPAMQSFLRLAGENPDRLAIALHEYSYLEEDIGHEYPYKVGRFQALFQAADELGIPRPTVLITEWGWEYADIPPVEDALKDVKWASRLYAAYPQVKGAAIWNVGIGCCFGDISEQVQELIDPLTELALRHYYALPADKQPVNPAHFLP